MGSTPKKKGGKASAKKTPPAKERAESMIPKKRTSNQAKRAISIRQSETPIIMDASQKSGENSSLNIAPAIIETPVTTKVIKDKKVGISIVSKKP